MILGLAVISVPFGMLYFLVRFVKWAWSDRASPMGQQSLSSASSVSPRFAGGNETENQARITTAPSRSVLHDGRIHGTWRIALCARYSLGCQPQEDERKACGLAAAQSAEVAGSLDTAGLHYYRN